MKIDPITLEVVRNHIDTIANEMETTLIKCSFSAIVKESGDASAAVFDRNGRTIAQAIAIPAHLGMLGMSVRAILRDYPPETMQEGDVYIHNDAYDGGTHLPDITILTPVVFEGQVVAISASMTHHTDIGGKTPGSTPADATEIFAEGLILPAVKLYDRGEPDEDVHRILRANSRTPEVLVGDLDAQIACVNVGKRRIGEMFEEYGVELLLGCIQELMNHGERMAREVVASIPDGDYSFYDYLDGDGIDPHRPVKVAATVQVRGSDMHFDFTGTDPEVRGAVNCPPSPRQAMEFFVHKAVCGPQLPNNDGCYRMLSDYAPPGTLVNPNPPRAVSVRTVTAKRIVSVLLGALAQAIPERVPAASDGQTNIMAVGGVHPRTGRPFVTVIAIPFAGALGGRPGKDGVDVVTTDLANTMRFPVEPFEMDFMFRVELVSLWQDSGGPGKFRGGLGNHAICRLLEGEVTLVQRRDRHDFAPWGLFGGKAAPRCRTVLTRAGGEVLELPSKIVLPLHPGDCLDAYTSGGGGYGDPLERDPWRVLDDVINYKVSVEAAAREYGVAIVDERVDEPATRDLRAQLSAERGPITWTYDRGESFPERTGLPRYQ